MSSSFLSSPATWSAQRNTTGEPKVERSDPFFMKLFRSRVKWGSSAVSRLRLTQITLTNLFVAGS